MVLKTTSIFTAEDVIIGSRLLLALLCPEPEARSPSGHYWNFTSTAQIKNTLQVDT